MIKIRKYRNPDFESLISLYKNKSAYGGNYDPSRDESVKLKATSDMGNLVIAENEDGQILGSAMILDNPHTFWLLRFVVDPEINIYREVCEALMANIEQIARKRNHQSIIVYTDPEDARLNQRYLDLKFKKGGQYQCYWLES